MNKDLFYKFIKNYVQYYKGIDRIEHVLSGSKKWGVNLFECDWNMAVESMFDLFIQSHFNEQQEDIINYYMFEKPSIIEGNLDSIDELWEEINKYNE